MPGSTASADPVKDDVRKNYQEIREYEQHFNSLETEIRKLASGWLLAALGAIAYLIKSAYMGDPAAPASKFLVEPGLLIFFVCLAGNLGLVVLWILDQMVYHRLLNAVFLLGLMMEYKYAYLPPVRTLMMLYSLKRGMARYLRYYYFIPMAVLAGIAIYFALWIGLACALIPLLAFLKSRRLETYTEISQGFPKDGFTDYLASSGFEVTLKTH